MKYLVFILPQARRDIERNSDWWAEHHSLDEAIRWSDTIYDQIASLTEFPESHAISPENDEFPYEIRDKLLGSGSRPSHRAVFTIRNDAVFVLAVRRGSQDVLRPGDVELQ